MSAIIGGDNTTKTEPNCPFNLIGNTLMAFMIQYFTSPQIINKQIPSMVIECTKCGFWNIFEEKCWIKTQKERSATPK